ncbi:hypothetical protein MBLNU457_g0817t1 [Dothideomycetes sp. NU457]
MKDSTYNLLHFDLDNYINPYIPASRISRLPRPIAHFLGYRKTPHRDVPNLLVYAWAFIGAFIGLLMIEALSKYAPGLQQYNPPIIIASLGASAILDYNAIHTPLAQPRNAFFGQLLSSVLGVGISKLFQLGNFDSTQWIAGALACAVSSFAMGVTGTVHPPGGATAVLACTNAQIVDMGWMFIPFVMMGSVIMLAWALIVNNLQRQYPNYWWTAEELPRGKVRGLEKVDTRDSQRTLAHEQDQEAADVVMEGKLVVEIGRVLVPERLRLTQREIELLAELQRRLREVDREEREKSSLSRSSDS